MFNAELEAQYTEFLRAKIVVAKHHGFDACPPVNPMCKPHQADCIPWAIYGGRRALFLSFGLGKTFIQLEIARIINSLTGGRFLIVAPLGVRLEFAADAAKLGIGLKFVRRIEECDETGVYITNYETIRDGKMNPMEFQGASLDESSCLRGFGGSKTFREFMRLFDGMKYKYVATATPAPNDYIELLAYAAFLEIMDVGEAKTRFFKRDSMHADKLTIHPHKQREFWLWCATWGIFVTKPSDLGHSDEGYDLPELDVRWHKVATDHSGAGAEISGQARMFRQAAISLPDASREKRDSLPQRIDKLLEIRSEDPEAHRLIWHDLEREREAVSKAIRGVPTVWGSQDMEERENTLTAFANGLISELSTKPSIAGSGSNFQRHCNWAIFLGIGFKFNDFIQAIHRIHRFLQTKKVRIDIIYTEAETEVRRILETKWEKHKELVANMGEIIREFGLAEQSLASAMQRSMGTDRVAVSGQDWLAVNNDCVQETMGMESNSVGLVLTSIPFSTQYEYTPSFNDFGHTDSNDHFFQQMDFLTPQLLRVLKPGAICAIHVKDRIVPGGMTGLGFQTVYPFHMQATMHFIRHGFAYLGMKTIVTDVVRENNQTYRLGWSEQCKDGTKMGVGMPEYLLIFRKPPTDSSNSYADEPVLKSKPLCVTDFGEFVPFDRNLGIAPNTGYSRSRWQIDAHGFSRSSGDRGAAPEDWDGLKHDQIFKLFRKFALENVYNFEHHVAISESLESKMRLPVSFMLLQPPSWSPEVWSDVTRMLSLNGAQSAKGKEMHLCLARGSMVLTKEYGYIPIQDVQPGDSVLTHLGRWRKVLIARNTGVQPVVTIRAQGSTLTLTPDHKLWTRKVRKLAWSKNHSRKEAKQVMPDWARADETVGSYINSKLPPVEAPSTESPEYWWTVGRWIADGHVGGRGGSYVISCGDHKVDSMLAHLGKYGGNKLHQHPGCVQITLRDPGKSLLRTLAQCGHGALNKKLPPEAFSLPKEQASLLLAGYLSGDGYYLAPRNRWMASSISKTLLLGIGILAQRVFGAVCSVYPGRPEGTAVIDGRTVHTHQDWILSFDVPDSSRRKGLPFVLEDGAWNKVRSFVDAGAQETWCLKVEEDESFTAEGAIVKNCPMQFDIADRAIVQYTNPGDTVYDPFGGLMTVPYRAVLKGRKGIGVELNPRYFYDGCQYLKAAEEKMNMPTLFDLLEEKEEVA